jgi:nucleoside phosphorylase
MAAGERLIADGSLAEMRTWDGRILAGDQEDSGFAQACDFNKTAWCVFRGISDHGDPLKNKNWHFAAALTAAATAYAFIEQAYRPAESKM